MKTTIIVLLAALVAAAPAFADDPKPAHQKSEKKAHPAKKSDKNVFQKTESSVGKFMNDNHIWVTHPDKSGKKSEK